MMEGYTVNSGNRCFINSSTKSFRDDADHDVLYMHLTSTTQRRTRIAMSTEYHVYGI